MRKRGSRIGERVWVRKSRIDCQKKVLAKDYSKSYMRMRKRWSRIGERERLSRKNGEKIAKKVVA